MKIVRAFNFTTITSEDWKRELARARKNPNRVREQIKKAHAQLVANREGSQ